MIGLRAFQRTAVPTLRRAAVQQRRGLADTSGIGAKGFEGAADNAFNRERAAVKQHAAETSGE